MILHITTRAQWTATRTTGTYRGDTLESDGFIHCSKSEQVVDVAESHFQDRKDLVLLCIDEERLDAEVRYEDCYDAGETFPHIYGPLNVDAVIKVIDFPPNPDGSFTLPRDFEEFV
ncbi:MAG: DUF952 domain-containing protein, partial [Anaerolineae bacterium]